jgi:hypothetical protein
LPTLSIQIHRRLRPLIRLILTMTVNRLTEKMVFEGSEQKKNRTDY